MISLTDSFDEGIPMPASPRPNLSELEAELAGRDYSHFDRECVLSYARALGTLEGCAQVDPEDRAALDEVLERSWPAVPADSGRWDADTWQGAPSRWTIASGPWSVVRGPLSADAGVDTTPRDSLADDGRRTTDDGQGGLVPPELDASDPAEHDEDDEAFYAAWSDSLPPLAMETEPFHP